MKTLNLGRNGIISYAETTASEMSMVTMERALSNNRVLETLDLNGNNLGPEFMRLLTNGLPACLKTLKLRDNVLRAAGLRYVSQPLFRKDVSLTALDIGGNQICAYSVYGKYAISSEGLTVLTNLIRNAHTLRSLDICNNFIGGFWKHANAKQLAFVPHSETDLLDMVVALSEAVSTIKSSITYPSVSLLY